MQTKLLDLNDVLLRLALMTFLFLLVFELPVVHEAADGWLAGGRDLDQIQPDLIGASEGLGNLNNPYLLAVLINEPNGLDIDLLIDT
jgi:hypothetical protein